MGSLLDETIQKIATSGVLFPQVNFYRIHGNETSPWLLRRPSLQNLLESNAVQQHVWILCASGVIVLGLMLCAFVSCWRAARNTEEAAATKIQAVYRGGKTREDVLGSAPETDEE